MSGKESSPHRQPAAAGTPSGSRPDMQEALQHHRAGRLAQAAAVYDSILRADPRCAEALNLLGILRLQRGDYKAALALIDQAIAIADGVPLHHNNRGLALQRLGRFAEAAESYRTALALAPNYPEAHTNLGNSLQDLGCLEEAVDSYRRALALRQDIPETFNNLGSVLRKLRRFPEAVDSLRRALALRPAYPEALCNLGNVLSGLGQPEDALVSFQQAIALKPDYAKAHYGVAYVMTTRCDLDRAIASCRQAIAINPRYVAPLSSLLLLLNYHDDITPEALAVEHRRFGAVVEPASVPARRRPWRGRDPDRRLRVGYLSPDFRLHSCAFFIEPLLAAHDRTAVEVVCYSAVHRPDRTTDRLRGLADQWRSVVALSDADAADLVERDGIDVLVDLAGHSVDNRLPLFARKPAPLQVTWLGYPNTTGLAAMDYRLTDGWADPPGEADRLCTERLLRLPGSFLCYQPLGDAPEVAPSPAVSRGHVTFGSFNNALKITSPVIALWSTILIRMPDARLLLKATQLQSEPVRRRIIERFAAHGISAGRLDLRGPLPEIEGSLASYADMDIALDPFPYNGTTTTCEALWMGVPVIALEGRAHAGRVGVSLLQATGLTEFLAATPDEYVEKAVALAVDTARLAALRRSLRPRLAASALCDSARFARAVEAAYRQIWRAWCAGGAA